MLSTWINNRTGRYCSVALIFFLASVFTFGCKVKIKETDMRQLIASELPAGCPVTRVSDFLDTHNIGRTIYMKEEPRSSNYDLVSNAEKEKIRGYISASIPDSETNPLESYGLSMEFYFDGDDKFVTYRMRKLVD